MLWVRLRYRQGNPLRRLLTLRLSCVHMGLRQAHSEPDASSSRCSRHNTCKWALWSKLARGLMVGILGLLAPADSLQNDDSLHESFYPPTLSSHLLTRWTTVQHCAVDNPGADRGILHSGLLRHSFSMHSSPESLAEVATRPLRQCLWFLLCQCRFQHSNRRRHHHPANPCHQITTSTSAPENHALSRLRGWPPVSF